MSLHAWAQQWGIPWPAVVDLQRRFGMEGTPTPLTAGNVRLLNEDAVQNIVRLEAARKGVFVWRNNVGVLPREDGVPVRFGLANDSKAVNERVKSADLIGIRPRTVTHDMIGHTLGQFVSREIKAPNWHYSGTPREEAQLRWLHIVQAAGGDAAFATGEGSL